MMLADLGAEVLRVTNPNGYHTQEVLEWIKDSYKVLDPAEGNS